MTLVLVIDDVRTMAEQYAYDLKRLGGYDTAVATGGEEGLDILSREAVQCVILDLEMPTTDGFDVLRTLKERRFDVPVIVYTGTGNYDRCTQAIRLGAYSFIDKSESMERVVQEVENALGHSRLRNEVQSLRRTLALDTSLIGNSAAMEKVRETIARVAPIPSPVLIVGESGSGKELVARDVHHLSIRARERPANASRRTAPPPFVAINCAALPDNLVESELFGHERGAFTGAHRMHVGAFEAAGQGTLLLDEVGELKPHIQAKLLRVLEQREVTRVGGTRTIPVNARVLAATNRNLEEDVAGGSFRRDLLYRLNVHIIHVPPLRERLSDISALVDHFLCTISERFGVRQKELSPDVLDLLGRYDWRRNNVRELRNVVERMIIACDGPVIDAEHVPSDVVEHQAGTRAADGKQTFHDLKAEAERQIVVAALERNAWHITRTAADLGLADHSSLIKIMRRHNLQKP